LHWPAWQYWSRPQCTPHAPQFVGSERVSRQYWFGAVPHFANGAAQVAAQLPLEQTCPAGQAFPQAPQFQPSVAVSTQTPPQYASVPQVQAQAPFAQTWPSSQAAPQVPQFAGSFRRSAHAPSHSVRPAAQLVLQAP
jgi:hypothetical protein